MGYSPWGREEEDTTERLTLSPLGSHHRLFSCEALVWVCHFVSLFVTVFTACLTLT